MNFIVLLFSFRLTNVGIRLLLFGMFIAVKYFLLKHL